MKHIIMEMGDDSCLGDYPHQFMKIADETKAEGEQLRVPIRWGIKVMCAMCGQRRTLWTDGGIDIWQE